MKGTRAISAAERGELVQWLSADWPRCFEALAALEREPRSCRLLRLDVGRGRPAGLLMSARRETSGGAETTEFFLIRPPGEEERYELLLRPFLEKSDRWFCYLLDGGPVGERLAGPWAEFSTEALVFVRPAQKRAAGDCPGGLARVEAPVPEEIVASTDLYSRKAMNRFARRGDMFAACAAGRPVSWAAIVHRFGGIGAVQVGMVYTVPEMRRRGLATALVWRVADEAGREGRRCIYDCAASNVPSRRTAVAAGYELVASYRVLGKVRPGPPLG